jgi:ferredoxin-NADP reductase
VTDAASSPAPATYRVTLDRVAEWTAGTRSLYLRLPDGVTLPFAPGQFVSLALPVDDGTPLVRAYSLASSPEDPRLEICVDRVPGGPGSAYLFGLRPGAMLELKGPFGSFLLASPPEAAMVFVGDGTGIAPIRPMVRRALAHGGAHAISVLQGVRPGATPLFGDEFRDLAARHDRLGWESIVAGAGEAPHEHRALEAAVRARFVDAAGDRQRHFWICGVGDLVTRLRDVLRGAGYERRAVRSEKW